MGGATGDRRLKSTLLAEYCALGLRGFLTLYLATEDLNFVAAGAEERPIKRKPMAFDGRRLTRGATLVCHPGFG